MDTNTIRMTLRGNVNGERYNHCVRVAELAQSLAVRFGEDAEKAYLAGLLHDCAKDLSAQEMIATAEEAGLKPNEVQRAQPIALLHAQVGAYIARRDYGVEDGCVLQAIGYHQSGGTDMTALDKIVSLADMTEPIRTSPDLDVTRRLLETDLDEAYLQRYASMIIEFLRGGQILIDKSTDVYNHLLLRRRKSDQSKQ